MAVKFSPIKIEQYARTELIKTLTKATFVDGASLDSTKIQSTKAPIFWERILDLDIAQRKQFYLVYNFETSKNIYSDNKVRFVEHVISLDLFTTQDSQSKALFDLRDKLETTFLENELFSNIELVTSFFDSEVKLLQYSYKTKIKVAIE